MKFLFNTGRTIRQGSYVERKNAPSYREEASAIRMNPVDMFEMMVEEGDRVRVKSSTGEVVMKARADPGLVRGRVFCSLGPYANHIVSPETHGTGMPDFKVTEVEIEPTQDPVSSVAMLMGQCGGVPYED
ncbi:MAG TPA: molybdopterin dinucleotide-binding protein [Methanolinea sp.]|jgi:formylmethanofuran dehydrogenase subunit D|nr:MAG: Molybdenum-containing formylmethanofuran dehydrogenase 1 subunit C [Methanoregulaceae archaeon PtaB.Bin009]OPY41702.1 MAG: Molybdenum-containing formylmethanofuran dehydrogenase 1 subunit C [Methanoregulaceae archaeon PtaU1.Bin066]HII77106.1 molybdopterin dinucleotide-binding protein [Methanolinea sp.]HNQ29300.1 molybdopterin dinucleotide binding domain-containing protein [Methanolinea sp.]HNS82290.1 molybdopterin dinucleotide binding domain-containing protein [Methanolinea sp.]